MDIWGSSVVTAMMFYDSLFVLEAYLSPALWSVGCLYDIIYKIEVGRLCIRTSMRELFISSFNSQNEYIIKPEQSWINIEGNIEDSDEVN